MGVFSGHTHWILLVWIRSCRWSPNETRGSRNSSWSWRKRNPWMSCWWRTAGSFRYQWRCLSIITHNYHLYNLYYYEKEPEVNKASVCVSCFVFSGCHQVPDLLRVASALKAHAAHVADFQPALTSSSLSRGNETRRHKTSEIWMSIYSAVSLTQAGIVQFVCSPPLRMPGWEKMLYQKVPFVLLGNTRAVSRIWRQRRSREGELEGSN